jgi:hypothetical protein
LKSTGAVSLSASFSPCDTDDARGGTDPPSAGAAHRWWARGIPSHHHSPDKYVPNELFYEIVDRFMKMKGF